MEQTPISGMDREVFERVWRRVMPEDRADCPFTLPEEEPAPAGSPAPAEPAGREGEPEPAALPAPSGEALRQYMDGELASWRKCRALARRLPGSAGQALAAVADDELRHARRLGALYFLLSGVRYWPRQGEGGPIGAIPAALRERFWAAHQAAGSYRAAALQAGGGRQQELFAQLAGEEERHLRAFQEALERL